jgi:uncharacterized protein (DUF58 family)
VIGSGSEPQSGVYRTLACVSPDRRLLTLLGGWVLAAALAVMLPALALPLALALTVLLGVAVADAALILGARTVGLERRLPERCAVGQSAEIELLLRNPGPRDLALEVFDELPSDLISPDPHFEAVRVAAGSERRLSYRVTPQVRGDRALGPAVVLVPSPFGLFRRRVTASAGEVLPVYPNASRFLRPEALDARRVLASLGVKPHRRRGQGMDFESLREYVPGDDPRRIDWLATARRGRLVTRLFQHERNHTVVIAVDTSRLMGGRSGEGRRTKLDQAIDAALALVYAALAAGDRAGLAVFDRELRAQLSPRSRRADLGVFVDTLRPLQSRLVEADYRVLARSLLVERQKRSLVVILTDFADVDASALLPPLALLARRHRVLVVALRDESFGALDSHAASSAGGGVDLYRRIVLDDLLREREETLSRLRQHGLYTLDLVSEEVTAPVLNRYLALRYDERARC